MWRRKIFPVDPTGTRARLDTLSLPFSSLFLFVSNKTSFFSLKSYDPSYKYCKLFNFLSLLGRSDFSFSVLIGSKQASLKLYLSFYHGV